MALRFKHDTLININYALRSVNGLAAVIHTHWTVASVKSASLLSLWDITSPNVRKNHFHIIYNQSGSASLELHTGNIL